jgi:DNA-binding MarR family transcriptional regulator
MRKVGGKSVQSEGRIHQPGDSVLMEARFLSKSVTGIFDEALRPFGISSTQFVLLSIISQAGSITRAEIARLQHLDRSTLTRNLRVILSAGWVREVRDNADGRSKPIALTVAGKDLVFDAHHAWLKAQDRAKTLLGADGMMALVSIVDRIADSSEKCSDDASRAIVNSAD